MFFSQFSMLPDNLKQEVVDFVAFLSQKNSKKAGEDRLREANLTPMAMAMSEKSLREDWENEDYANWESFLKD